MKLVQLGPNQHVLKFNDGREVFFSYETPVAGYDQNGYWRTSLVYSVTTSKHINKYINFAIRSGEVRTIAPESVDLLMELTKLGGV